VASFALFESFVFIECTISHGTFADFLLNPRVLRKQGIGATQAPLNIQS
jgi:hypothetical protein